MARFHLRLSDEEFFRLTPRQFHLLLARHREHAEHQQFLVGILASTVANFSMSAPKTPLTPADFMPRPSKKKKERSAPRHLIAETVRGFFAGRLAAQNSNAA